MESIKKAKRVAREKLQSGRTCRNNPDGIDGAISTYKA
jgi:hypothetical protein